MPYTPGPWVLNDDCIEANGPEGPRDVTVATVNMSLPGNIRLLVNAPALVERLSRCADWLGHYADCDSAFQFLSETRALLEVVTGEEYPMLPENSDG